MHRIVIPKKLQCAVVRVVSDSQQDLILQLCLDLKQKNNENIFLENIFTPGSGISDDNSRSKAIYCNNSHLHPHCLALNCNPSFIAKLSKILLFNFEIIVLLLVKPKANSLKKVLELHL